MAYVEVDVEVSDFDLIELIAAIEYKINARGISSLNDKRKDEFILSLKRISEKLKVSMSSVQGFNISNLNDQMKV